MIKRWTLPGQPRGVAVGGDGTIYLGLADTQSLVAVDPETGSIIKEVVLDSAEIAATKELVSLRLNHDGTALAIANGSDESATIVAIPGLSVRREITLEGELIRDVLYEASARYLFVLGRSVHVFDRHGARQIRQLEITEPMAMAVDSRGTVLAVAGREDFGNGKVSVVAFYDLETLKEITREPLETDRIIQQLLFAAGDRVIVALASDWLGEKSLTPRPPKGLIQSERQARVRIEFGDLMSTERICLPEKSGPQIAALGKLPSTILFAERHCSTGSSFKTSPRKTSSVSLYGVSSYAIAYDSAGGRIVATDPAGSLTIYRVPASNPKR